MANYAGLDELEAGTGVPRLDAVVAFRRRAPDLADKRHPSVSGSDPWAPYILSSTRR